MVGPLHASLLTLFVYLFNVCIQTFVNFLLDCLPFLDGLVKSEIFVPSIFFCNLLSAFYILSTVFCVMFAC